MQIEIRVHVALAEDEQFGFDYDGTTYRAREVLYVPGEPTVLVYAVKVYKNGGTTTNAFPLHRPLATLPVALQDALARVSIAVTVTGTETVEA